MATNEAGNAPQAQNKPKTKKKHHVRIDSAAWSNLSHHLSSIDDDKTITNRSDRLIVVRYYLDRPGYGLHNSAARLWFNAPSRCTPLDIQTFLEQQRISLPGLLVEVYLDKYESFMLLEACESSCVEWDFQHVTYHDPGILNIRLTDVKAAEQEEYESYHGRMSEEWLRDLEKFDTNWHKPFIEIAPWIIVVFKRIYDLEDGEKKNNYYVNESVGIACGMLITAIHQAGLVTLTHTPSPMNFLSKILNRPSNERPFLLLPVGYAATNAEVPKLSRKSLNEICISYD